MCLFDTLVFAWLLSIYFAPDKYVIPLYIGGVLFITITSAIFGKDEE